MDEEKIHLLDDCGGVGRTSRNYGCSPNEKYNAQSKNCTSPTTQLSSISPTIDTSSRRRSSIAAMAAAAESMYSFDSYVMFVHIICTKNILS